MSSELRIIAFIIAAMALAAWAAKSWAAEPRIHGEPRLTAPPQLQTAIVRAAVGASARSVSGF